MPKVEFKKQLIDIIEAKENDSIPEKFYRIVDIGEDNFAVHNLSEHQKMTIEIEHNDISNSHFTSHEEAKKEFDTWQSKIMFEN